MRQIRLLSHGDMYSSRWTSGGSFATRLFRRFEDGELDALRASGEGLLGGPPTTSKSDGSAATSRPALARPALLEARELRRSFGGGMGSGDDMVRVRKAASQWVGEIAVRLCEGCDRGRREGRAGANVEQGSSGGEGAAERQAPGLYSRVRGLRNGRMLPHSQGSHCGSLCVVQD